MDDLSSRSSARIVRSNYNRIVLPKCVFRMRFYGQEEKVEKQVSAKKFWPLLIRSYDDDIRKRDTQEEDSGLHPEKIIHL